MKIKKLNIIDNNKNTIPSFGKTGSFIRTANKVKVAIKHKYGIDLTISEIEEIVSCQFKLQEPMKNNQDIRIPYIGRFVIKPGRKVMYENLEEIKKFAEDEGITTGFAIKRYLKEIRPDVKTTFERHTVGSNLKMVKLT